MDDVDAAYADAEDRAVVARLQALSEAGPVASLADVREWPSSGDPRRTRATARARLFATTRKHWTQDPDGLIRPRAGAWLLCPVCRTGSPVLRSWRFHKRPGTPTAPYRCDVSFKCSECAAGWWHGVAIPLDWWLRRPMPEGLRALLSKGSSFEPSIWASDRRHRRG